MGIDDRHYNRADNSMYRPVSGRTAGEFLRNHFNGAHVTRNLIILNTAVWLLGMVLFDWAHIDGEKHAFLEWGAFNVADTFHKFQLWRLLANQFIHVEPLHLLFNMITLFFFGPIVERWLDSRRYLAFYLICGSAAVLGKTIAVYAKWLPDANGIGASGAIFGVLAACAVIAPNTQTLLMGFIRMPMRVMVILILVIAGFSLAVRTNNPGGGAVHLGGAVFGFILIKLPWLLNWARVIPLGSSVRLAPTQPNDDGWLARSKQKQQEKALRRERETRVREENELDRVLDKVKAEGLHKLTAREKATLQRATERQRGRG